MTRLIDFASVEMIRFLFLSLLLPALASAASGGAFLPAASKPLQFTPMVPKVGGSMFTSVAQFRRPALCSRALYMMFIHTEV